MKLNIDEYETEHYCFKCGRTVSQPRAVISMSMENPLNGEIHLHRRMDLSCHGERMIADSKGGLISHSYDIDDTTESYEACAKLVMGYIKRDFEITYLKLG